MSMMPDLTTKERLWKRTHGCIHGLYPDETPIFCPTCRPDASDLMVMLQKNMDERKRAAQAKDI